MRIDGSALRADLVGQTGGIASLGLVVPGRVIAGAALEGRAEPLVSPLLREHPRALLPRWAVADVLAVPALEQRHPVPDLVSVEAHDGALHYEVPQGALGRVRVPSSGSTISIVSRCYRKTI
jgi:hypothetical protein